MRSKLWILLICLHCLAFTAAAQSPAKRQLVLPIATGGFVAFRSETRGWKRANERQPAIGATVCASCGR